MARQNPAEPPRQERSTPGAESSARGLSSNLSEEQTRLIQAFDDALQEFQSTPDDDPPGAWEEAMRDLDAHRPHRKLFEGILD